MIGIAMLATYVMWVALRPRYYWLRWYLRAAYLVFAGYLIASL